MIYACYVGAILEMPAQIQQFKASGADWDPIVYWLRDKSDHSAKDDTRQIELFPLILFWNNYVLIGYLIHFEDKMILLMSFHQYRLGRRKVWLWSLFQKLLKLQQKAKGN